MFILENIFIVETSQPTNENHYRRSRMVHAPNACTSPNHPNLKRLVVILCQVATPIQTRTSDSSSSVDADESLECWQITAESEAPETEEAAQKV
jgi:hypothetical protein